MSKTTKRTQPKLDHAEKAVNKPELGHAKDSDLPQSKNWSRWTATEDQILRDNAGKISSDKIGEKLNRTRCAVEARAHALGISIRVAKSVLVDKIRELAGTMSARDIAKTLGKSHGNISSVASRAQISLKFTQNPWTPEQDNYLRKNASLLTAREISRVLGRTLKAVESRVLHLDISLAKHHRAHHQVKSLKSQKAVPLKFKNRPLPDDCN